MVPVIRWAIGPAGQSGFDCLKLSIDLWRNLYGNSFEYYVCHNQLSLVQISQIEKLGVNLLDQNLHRDSLIYEPFDTAWKLYPPRIKIDSHEIFIDNDLLIYSKMPVLEEYLNSTDMFLVTSAHKRFYGVWDFLVPQNFPNVNTGFFALPPNYDLKKVLHRTFQMYPGKKWQTHFDEEGIMAAVMAKKNLRIIPMEDIYVTNPGMTNYKTGLYGTHFAGINSGNDEFFKRYLRT